MKNILIIRLSSLGDVILTTFIPRMLKENYKDININFVVYDSFADILNNNPFVDRLFIISKTSDNKEFISNISKITYDYIFDLQNNRISRTLTSKLVGKINRIKKENWKKLLLIHFKINIIKPIKSVTQKYFSVIEKYLEIENPDFTPQLFCDSKYIDDFIEDFSNDEFIIAVAPGSKHKTKQYPPDKFIEVINKLNNIYKCKFILLGNADENDICEYIALETKNCINLAGKTSIKLTTALIRKSNLLITNDSALMHIAYAFNVPQVSIFGSTVKEFGFLPEYNKIKLIENDILCRPCTHIGRSKCPKRHFKCMNDIHTDEIVSAVLKLLNK